MIEKLLLFYRRASGFRTHEMGPFARVCGIIFNSIKANVDISVPKMRIHLRINQFKRQKLIPNEASIFDATIRDATIVRRAVTLGLPVCLVGVREADEGVGADYEAVTAELLGHPIANKATVANVS